MPQTRRGYSAWGVGQQAVQSTRRMDAAMRSQARRGGQGGPSEGGLAFARRMGASTIGGRSVSSFRSRSSRLGDAYQTAYDEAKEANEKRYQDILGQYQQRRTRALQYLEGAGKQEAADITQQFANLQGAGQQDLVSRGLTGTTILSDQRANITGKRVAAQGRLQERLQQQRLGVDVGLSGETLGFMERREDEYPDYAQLQQLAYMQGQGGGGRVGAYAGGSGGGGGGAFFPGLPAGGYQPTGASALRLPPGYTAKGGSGTGHGVVRRGYGAQPMRHDVTAPVGGAKRLYNN